MPHPSKADIATFIREVVARELDHDPAAIDDQKPLTRYGLDSVTAVLLTGELEDWLQRPVSPDLLVGYRTVEALSEYLAGSAEEVERESVLEPWLIQPLSRRQKLIRAVTAAINRLLLRTDVSGTEAIPASGAFIFACNHLHKLDVPVLITVLRRPVVFVVSEHMSDAPFVSWYLRKLGRSIWVARGEADRDALGTAISALVAGEVLAVAPEGKISRTGALQKGQTGVAYVAMRAKVPILPVVAYGQERVPQELKRFRRPRVVIRIGTPLDPPKPGSRVSELEEYTDRLMHELARMLPESYRGVYARAVSAKVAG